MTANRERITSARYQALQTRARVSATLGCFAGGAGFLVGQPVIGCLGATAGVKGLCFSFLGTTMIPGVATSTYVAATAT